MKYIDLKTSITVVFATSLVVANLVATKLIDIPLPIVGDTTASVAVFLIGVSFFCTDLISEIYGRETAHKVVNGTVIATLVVYVFVFLAVEIPPADSFDSNESFVTTFSSSYSIVTASVITILLSQNLDIFVFHRIKEKTGDEYKFIRNIGSTVVSQGIDTTVFTILGFVVLPSVLGGTQVPLSVAFGIISAEYLVKIIILIFDTPLFYALTNERVVDNLDIQADS